MVAYYFTSSTIQSFVVTRGTKQMGCTTMEMTIIQVTKTPFTRITPDNLLSGRIFVQIHLAFTWHCSIRTSFSHQLVEVFNLLRKCTSAVLNKYLYSTV